MLNIFTHIKAKIKKPQEDLTELFNKIYKVNYSRFYDEKPHNVIEEYWLEYPFSKAVIYEKNNEIVYEILEPKISLEEFYLIEKIHRYLKDNIIVNNLNIDNKEIYLFKEFINILENFKLNLSIDSIGRIWYHIKKYFLGYERIDPLLRDPYLEDISCSGYNLPVYVFHKAYGNIPTNIYYKENELDRFVLKLSQKAKTQISLERPLADGSISEKIRIQLTYKNVVSTRGSSFTIRKPRDEPITPLDLISWNTISAEVMGFLWLAIESRMNMIIVGGTASGKTTMLNAISFFIPYNSKIVSIEDTREVSLPHKNWLPLITRDMNGNAKVEMFDLLKAALRQRPEYIIVGEIRGREAITLFQAMGTGHVVYSTFHAGDVDSAIKRFLYDPLNIPRAMFSQLDLIMCLNLEYIIGKPTRKMVSLNEVSLDEEGRIAYHPIFRWTDRIIVYQGSSNVLPEICKILNMDEDEVLLEIKRRAKFLEKLIKERPMVTEELIRRINDYRGDFYENI